MSIEQIFPVETGNDYESKIWPTLYRHYLPAQFRFRGDIKSSVHILRQQKKLVIYFVVTHQLDQNSAVEKFVEENEYKQ